MSIRSAGVAAKPVFGKRREPHTIIIARGDEVSHFTLRPWLSFSLGALMAAVAVGYLLATSYLVFRDDLIGASISRQARIQQAYEDRIAALRAQVDRISSRQLLDQQLMENKVAELINRQEQLSARGGRLGPLLDRARTTGSGATTAAQKPEQQAFGYKAGMADQALMNRVFSKSEKETDLTDADRTDAMFTSISNSIQSIETTQLSEVKLLADEAETSAKGISKLLASVGLNVSGKKLDTAEGGPYIPADEGAEMTAFDIEVARLDEALDTLDSVKAEARQFPVGIPVPDADVTSSFGYRKDPLFGTQAFHAGIDFRGEIGRPILAPASGVVITAGRQGGYGNMIELRHANGITTRYGHLNSISVREGQKVEQGTLIGKIGNTGRSTGPHLHYEIRLDGKAVDPSRYLRVGRKIAPLM